MSATNGHKHARTDARRVILVGAPDADRALRRDPRIELVRAPNVYHALGELGADDAGETSGASVLLGPDAISPDSAEDVVASMREVDPSVSIFSIDDGVRAPAHEDIRAVAPGHLPGALFEPAKIEKDAETDRAVEKAPKKRKKKNKKNKRKAADTRADASNARQRAVASASAGDERVLLRIILSGGDPTHEILARSADALKSDQIEFVRAIEHENPPEITDGFVARKVARRNHTFGWLVGPAALDEGLTHEAENVALWLSLADQHTQLRTLAFTDSMTGAWNRRYFDKYLASAISEARLKRHSLTLMVFDIDDFKLYNDEYGHAAGDEILIETIRLLKAQVRPHDRVCRIGGDEFAVVFYDPAGPRDPASHHPRSLFQIARRFQKQIADHHFPKLAERAKGSLTISGGLATFPWDAYDAEGLLDRADHLAMQSKKQGKNVLTIGESAHIGDDEEHDGIDLPDAST